MQISNNLPKINGRPKCCCSCRCDLERYVSYCFYNLCVAAYSSQVTSLPVTSDVTRGGYDRRDVDFFAHRHLTPSPTVPAGFSQALLWHQPVERGSVADRCAPGARWPDDYWAWSSTPCDATVTPPGDARRRYHVTMSSSADVTDLVVKDERLTSVPSGMVAYAGLFSTLPLRQPHSGTSTSISDSPIPSPITSSFLIHHSAHP